MTEDVMEETISEDQSNMRRKKDIVDYVANTTGLKKRDVREALDAAFGYLRTELSEGHEIAYPTLGKVKISVQRPDSENPKTQYRVVLAKEVADIDENEVAGDSEEG